MCDSAVTPHELVDRVTIVAGYLDSPAAARVWSDADWVHVRALAPWLLPIWVAHHFERAGDGVMEAHLAVAQARRLVPAGAPGPFTIACDIEQSWAVRAHESGYAQAWADSVRAMGWVPMIYTSASVADLFIGTGALLWEAQWNNTPALSTMAAATQYASPLSDAALSVDLSVVAPMVRFIPATFTKDTPHVATLNGKINTIVATHDDGGYWLVGSDGGVFAFGNAPALTLGANVKQALRAPISAAACTSSSRGLWLAGEDGGVFALGDATYHGGIPDVLHLAPAPDTDPVPHP